MGDIVELRYVIRHSKLGLQVYIGSFCPGGHREFHLASFLYNFNIFADKMLLFFIRPRVTLGQHGSCPSPLHFSPSKTISTVFSTPFS